MTLIRIVAWALLAGCGPSHGPTAAPVAPAATVTAATPCIPGPPLVASELYTKLEKYAWSLYLSEDETPPPPTTFGSCSVNRNLVRAADGTLVAELGCGVRVLVPGILDDLGLQLGARGQDVLDRKPRPVQPLTCIGNGPDQVRCRFDREPDRDTDASWYVVAGTLGDDALTGEAATKFFGSRSLIEIEVSMWCH